MATRSLRWLGLPLAILLALPLPGWARLTDAEAVSVAGLQAMLSERITKSYLMLGQQLNVAEARNQREQAAALFDRNLQELKAYAPTPELNALTSQLQTKWQSYRQKVLATPHRETALAVLLDNDDLQQQNAKILGKIQDHISASQMVNLSGRPYVVVNCSVECLNRTNLLVLASRQHVLSQRIARLYLSKSWGLAYPNIDQNFQTAVSQYNDTLNELLAASENTPEIQDGLRRVRGLWSFSKQGLDLTSNSLFVPGLICSTTEKLLTRMQVISKLYQQEIQRLNNKNLSAA